MPFVAAVLIPIISYSIDISIKLTNKQKLSLWASTDKFKVGYFLKIFTKIIPTSILKFEVLQIHYFYLQKLSW